MASFEDVFLSVLDDSGNVKQKYDTGVKVDIKSEQYGVKLMCTAAKQELLEASVDQKAEMARVGEMAVMLSLPTCPLMLKFASKNDQSSFVHHLKEALKNQKQSVFNERTDAASAEQYFQFYGYLSQQQNMMQDYIRTSTYQRAMLDNTADFNDKIVLDVGAGSGILSFFAVQAGAKRVYAIEASSMATHCEKLVASNKLSDKIVVVAGKIEEIDLPEKVDIIVSEPMGYMLFNERMLETYLHAKKWLKPGGLMFPSVGDLHIAPFTDDALLSEQYSKANFWYQPAFHGVDLSCLREASVQEYFKQPIVDTFDIRSCLAQSHKYTVDFRQCHESDLHILDIPLSFLMQQSGTIHGLAFWFDVAFIGTQTTVWLSTSPTQPLTHWYQVRCLLPEPVFVKQGEVLQGRVRLVANTRQSYDVEIELTHPSTQHKSSNTLDLKNPFFRFSGSRSNQPNTSLLQTYHIIHPLLIPIPVGYQANNVVLNNQGHHISLTTVEIRDPNLTSTKSQELVVAQEYGHLTIDRDTAPLLCEIKGMDGTHSVANLYLASDDEEKQYFILSTDDVGEELLTRRMEGHRVVFQQIGSAVNNIDPDDDTPASNPELSENSFVEPPSSSLEENCVEQIPIHVYYFDEQLAHGYDELQVVLPHVPENTCDAVPVYDSEGQVNLLEQEQADSDDFKEEDSNDLQEELPGDKQPSLCEDIEVDSPNEQIESVDDDVQGQSSNDEADSSGEEEADSSMDETGSVDGEQSESYENEGDSYDEAYSYDDERLDSVSDVEMCEKISPEK